jgi:hypothetical protein
MYQRLSREEVIIESERMGEDRMLVQWFKFPLLILKRSEGLVQVLKSIAIAIVTAVTSQYRGSPGVLESNEEVGARDKDDRGGNG